MTALHVSDVGLALRRPEQLDNDSSKTNQFMRLNLAQGTLDELIQSLRTDQKARLRLGKHPTLYYGSKSQQFRLCPEANRSEVYCLKLADEESLYFTGVLSHNLEVQKAKEATAATDQALAKLEESLSAFERGKESKKTHIISSIDEVKALQAGSRKQAALLARGPSSKVELEKDRLWKDARSRSLTSSPALGPARSPVSAGPVTPILTSASLTQNKDRLRREALKVPFIHLLAIRAVSAKFLARQTRSPLEDCLALAQKYGTENRINREKFDLRDKAYRELDVWKFPYPSQEDRQEAIENAISAFDRMRISRTDKLWQMLLPKEERGKGKVLSRLDLRTGPIKRTGTPLIHVQAADENGKEGYNTGNETDRATNGASTPAPTPTSVASTQKKRPADKDTSSKRSATKNKNVNSTLTGRVTKKAEKKPAKAANGKFKSTEFVDESEEEDTHLPETTAAQNAHPETETTRLSDKVESKTPISKTPEPSQAPSPKKTTSDSRVVTSEAAAISSKAAATATKRLSSSLPSNNNTSLRKPSPLASSPPTNASDINNSSQSSRRNGSSSSSPLVAQKPSAANSVETKVAKVNGSVKPMELGNSLKRKAENDRPSVKQLVAAGQFDGNEPKRRRAGSISSGSTGSTGSASPLLGRELLLKQLRDKSRLFKQYYAKYRNLHDEMASHPDPPRADLDRLQRQHVRLQRMKKEIWEEDRRLRALP